MTPASELDPEKIRAAFFAGIAYHDALMMLSSDEPDTRGHVIDNDRLDLLFESWHNRIADALGVEP